MKRACLFLICNLWITMRLYAQTEYVQDGSPTALEEEIRWLLNRGRYDFAAENAARGTAYAVAGDGSPSAGPLAPHEALIRSARRHSEDMARRNTFQHDTLSNSFYYDAALYPGFQDRMEVEGYDWGTPRENIAASQNLTTAQIYLGWWNSTYHREDMYVERLTDFGCGHYYSSSSKYWHYYTMDLGRTRSYFYTFTGTLFYDADHDGRYDQGEGVPGIEVGIEVNGTATGSYDVSGTVGSFAIPIMDIPSGTGAVVLLRNTTEGIRSLSIPQDYHNFETVTLAPGESVALGGFTRVSGSRNVGFRNLNPLPPEPSWATYASVATDFTVSWNSSADVQYRIERSTNLVDWIPAHAAFSNGTGAVMTFTDGGAFGRDANSFYRIVARWMP
ncbi:hypothetical protein PDESU_03841 [Pontiella desulfatans]|uniref:SCP domain-containing protein n=1 Tax=Pontiella desulfatans TaxID=2750659 RepID=A0A6C2U5Y0_PONDE|nr:CAP domain-containing protein [Pontiella desulfatans]VGO15259.1 hypothetical protein PDESU_03841 [Pontiella desulfatans]